MIPPPTARIAAFGHYLPERALGNAELADRLSCDPAWILQASGIEARRLAAADETVVSMGISAGRACLALTDAQVGCVIVSCGSSEARFPGPAAEIALGLGLAGIPAIDLPLASAGAIFGMALAGGMIPGNTATLLIATEKMSGVADPADKNTAILFGDGAGACLISPEISPRLPGLEILDSVLHSDGTWAHDLRLDWGRPLHMNGPTVIMQAARKIPTAIAEVLARNAVEPSAIRAFIMHQANQNLIDRVAKALGVPADRFFSNIRRYGNTSSASMLIAASEWSEQGNSTTGDHICFAGFGAGFHWGAVLARQ